jgi:hypothetical protein
LVRRGIARPQDEHAAAIHFALQKRAFIKAVAVDDMGIASAVYQFDVACGSGAVVPLPEKRALSLRSHAGDTHELPDVDDDFRIANQEQVQSWIAGNRLLRHAAKDRRPFAHRHQLATRFSR